MGVRAAILLMRASRSVGRGEHCHKRGDAEGARTSFRRAIDLVDAAGSLGPLGVSIQMAAIQGVVENSVGADFREGIGPAVERVLACFDKDPVWRTAALVSDWEKWARALLERKTIYANTSHWTDELRATVQRLTEQGWSSPLKDRTGQTAVESESAHGKEA